MTAMAVEIFQDLPEKTGVVRGPFSAGNHLWCQKNMVKLFSGAWVFGHKTQRTSMISQSLVHIPSIFPSLWMSASQKRDVNPYRMLLDPGTRVHHVRWAISAAVRLKPQRLMNWNCFFFASKNGDTKCVLWYSTSKSKMDLEDKTL